MLGACRGWLLLSAALGCGLSSLDATRLMGGSCGGYGDMGELETWLAWSEKRGEMKYSVLCEGDGRGTAAGLGAGSGDARLEALRFAWPGLR